MLCNIYLKTQMMIKKIIYSILNIKRFNKYLCLIKKTTKDYLTTYKINKKKSYFLRTMYYV